MYIDLSVLLNEKTPVYPGDSPIKVEPAGSIEDEGWNDHIVLLNTHVGTHIDAPLHMIPDGKTLNQIPLEQFIGRGHLIEVDKEFSLTALKNAGIQADEIVLFQTGMSKHYYEPHYFEQYPVMSEAMAQYLIEQKVKMVGVDTASVDNLEDFPIHKMLLSSEILIIENLSNLNELTDKTFTIYALPIRLDLDGAPARVVAVTQE